MFTSCLLCVRHHTRFFRDIFSCILLYVIEKNVHSMKCVALTTFCLGGVLWHVVMLDVGSQFPEQGLNPGYSDESAES